jgi:4-alpha-glucanotransferase
VARAHGVQTSFVDATGSRRVATRSALVAVLRALGVSIERLPDAPGALRELTGERFRRISEPVAVAPDGAELVLALRLPRRDLPARVACRLVLEDGAEITRSVRTGRLPTLRETQICGRPFVELELRLRGPWPLGYHRLELEIGRRTTECVVVAAPRRAHTAARRERRWGAFLPLHALHGATSRGVGNYGDLERLVDWTADLGGRCLGTLPLLPTFLDTPFDPSPYMPISRLVWSDLHLEIDDSPLARSPAVRRRLSRLREAQHVDHREQSALQRLLLEPLCAEMFSGDGARRSSFRRFIRAHPEVRAYARFRATGEAQARPWQHWPARLREGRLRATDYDRQAERYHAFTQWLAASQLDAVARRARERDLLLYLDLPLGVHGAGYDTWRERELFAQGASVGAPPDAFFTRGQTWCSPPVRPSASRDQGHRYLAACLRHHMRVAGMLRIDHVMSLHRLFWIPDGHDPQHGLYVRYPARELYAIVCLESVRQGCLVVGEDLGTVPREVRPTMRRHGISRTSVMQFGPPPAASKPEGVAGLQTHDMPTFAEFWRGSDIGRRVRLGHLTAEAARPARRDRERLKRVWLRDLRRGGWLSRHDASAAAVLRACLAFLADSPAETVLVDVEDLWGETRPQNIPGTTTEWPNWRRRTRYPLEIFATMPRVLRALSLLRERRS